jgi:uncharacterized protein YbaP (TraB family)
VKPNRRILLSVFALACLIAMPRLLAQPAPAVRKAMFWKVASKTGTVYLLGSIHLGSKEMYPLAGEIEEAFDGSAVVAVEADIRKVDMQKMQAMIFEKGMYAADDSLWNHVSPETRTHVQDFCAKYGMPAEAVARLKPWVVALTASTLPMMKGGMDPSLGIDNYFLQKAGSKRVVEIESAEWQVNLLSGFSDDLQEKFLAAATQESIELEDTLKPMQEAWLSGDVAKMDGIIRQASRTPEAINKAMLADRNPHMADIAEQLLKGKEQGFVIVGAAHLVGRDGVVDILTRRGYKVDQVALKK